MKRIFQYISVCLLLIVTGTGCEDNDNWRTITALQEGIYVAGDATVYSATASAAAFGNIYIDPADQVAPGLSGMYTWLKGGSPFYLITVDAEGNQTQLGAGSEITLDGAEGKTYAAEKDATLSVDHDGFYCLIYNATDNQISLVEYVMTIIGDATPGKWDAGTPMNAPVYNEATSTVEYTLTDVSLNSKELKFRVGSNWQFKIPYSTTGVTVAAGYGPGTATDLSEASVECSSEPGLPNFKITKAGLYDIILAYELRSKKFMAKALYKGEDPNIPDVQLPTNLYLVGSFNGWDWAQSPEMIPVNGVEGKFWGIYYFNANEEIKFNSAKDWNGNEFGAASDDPQGYGEIAVGSSNLKIQHAGFYQIVITCTLNGSDITKTLELMEPAIYLMGTCAPESSWSGASSENRFILQGDLYVSPAVNTSDQLRIFVEIPGLEPANDWWKTEFIILNGQISYRGNGGDQERVAVTAGQIVKLNFKNNTGTIE